MIELARSFANVQYPTPSFVAILSNVLLVSFLFSLINCSIVFFFVLISVIKPSRYVSSEPAATNASDVLVKIEVASDKLSE